MLRCHTIPLESRNIFKGDPFSTRPDEEKQQTMEEKAPDALEMAAKAHQKREAQATYEVVLNQWFINTIRNLFKCGGNPKG